MSIIRRRQMLLADADTRLIKSIDFSNQKDNEIWYLTTDGQRYDWVAVLNIGWGNQTGLEVISHSYSDGIGKLVCNTDILKIGENWIQTNKKVTLLSFPRKFLYIHAFCLYGGKNLTNIIFLGNIPTFHRDFRPIMFSGSIMHVSIGKMEEAKQKYSSFNIAQFIEHNFQTI